MVWAAFLMAISALLAMYRWRLGLLSCIAVGFFQDPIRKSVDGQPGLLITLVAMAFAFVYLAALLKRVPLKFSNVYAQDRRLKTPWIFFVSIVMLQCGVSLVRFGNPAVPVLGLITYLSPLAATLMGIVYGKTEKDFVRFFSVYLVFAVPFALSVYLSYFLDEQWDVLKDIGAFSGKRLLIYDVGTVLHSYSGFLRVGETAAWHAAMASIMLIVFLTLQSSITKRWLMALLIALLIGAILLTGRRKMLMALTVFIGVYAFLLIYYWHGIKKVAVAVILIASGISALLFFEGDPGGRQSLYVVRGLSVFESMGERLQISWNLFQSAIDRAGFFGFGAGIATQGAQNFGVDSSMVGGSTEAGTGKLVSELGVHGLIITLWLLFRIGKSVSRLLRNTPKRYFSLTVFMSAFVAIMVANAATFFVATQLYGDLFILLLLGLMAGFLFATGNICRMYKRCEAMNG